eukprot:scaffold9545_cov115-Amphora_coffeaeformis.AAC.1
MDRKVSLTRHFKVTCLSSTRHCTDYVPVEQDFMRSLRIGYVRSVLPRLMQIPMYGFGMVGIVTSI